MCDHTNAQTIVEELLHYLEKADYSIRETLVWLIHTCMCCRFLIKKKETIELRWLDQEYGYIYVYTFYNLEGGRVRKRGEGESLF